MARGRRSKLTPEIQDRIRLAILASNYLETACWSVGITPRTGYNWLKRGEDLIALVEDGQVKQPSQDKDYQFFLFALTVRRLEAEAEIADIAYIKSGKDGWQARAWIRERRSKERWSRRDYQEIKVLGTLGLKAEDLPDDQLAAIIKGVAVQRGSRGGTPETKGSAPAPD